MAAGVAAAAAAASGAALLLYLLLTCRPSPEAEVEEGVEVERRRTREAVGERWPERPPATCCEAAAVAARTVRRTWELTVGRWGLRGIAFGIKRHMKRQGSLQHEYTASNCRQLKGHEAYTELVYLLEYLKLCMFFSKRPFAVFLKFGGYSREDVLIQKSRARLMKPAFALLCDKNSKCFLLFIRGAISTKERLTAATAAEVPFHHIVLREGQISNVILGYAHCGMVAAARWIAEIAVPHLHDAVHQFPDYQIKIIGHSMGAGIGAILTYILREHREFSSCTCLAFAPAACMTWELAESGKEFVTSLVNRTDVVPAFSKVSAENLRSEVVVSSKLDDQKDQVNLRFFETINQHVSFIKSQMLFMSHSRVKTTDPESSISEPLLKHAGDVTQPAVNGHNSDCSRQDVVFVTNPRQDFMSSPTVTSEEKIVVGNNDDVFCVRSAAESDFAHSNASKEVDADNKAWENEESSLIRRKEEEAPAQKDAGKEKQNGSLCARETRQFFPPGRIIHMVALPPPDSNPGEGTSSNETIGIYETSRELYGKIRLAPNMIKEHYMPSYINTMESLLDQLRKDDSVCTASIDL